MSNPYAIGSPGHALWEKLVAFGHKPNRHLRRLVDDVLDVANEYEARTGRSFGRGRMA